MLVINLEKQGMFSKRKIHDGIISRQNWMKIIALMSHKAKVRLINPKTCHRCENEASKGQVITCEKM